MSIQPQGPNWWQASDGRWYPPQQASGPPARPVQPRKKSSGKGCLIAVVVVLGVLVVLGGIGAYFLFKAADTLSESGVFGTGGSVPCPAAAEVEAAVGSEVREPTGGSLVGSTGCAYLAVDQEHGMDVNIVFGPTLIADEQLADFADEGKAAGVEPAPIEVGERGQAWASERKSAATAIGGDRLVLVEIMSASGEPIGDHREAAIALLSKVIG